MKRLFRLGQFRTDAEQDVREELDCHLELEAEALEALGLSPVEARATAEARLGDRRRIEARAVRYTARWGRKRRLGGFPAALRQDLRHSLRNLLRARGATLLVLLTLTLGIGASTTVFSVFNALVLAPLPFGDVDRLIRIRQTREVPGQPARATSVTGANFRAWQERASRLNDMAAARFQTFSLAGEGDAERVVGIGATWNLFQVLGAPPLHGRAFHPDEDRPGDGASVAVISHSLWSRRFGEDPDALGGEIVIGDRPYTVVGIMPPAFRYPYSAEVWIPLALGPESPEWTRGILNVSARLMPGRDMEGAREEMEAIAGRLREERPETNAGVGVALVSIKEEVLEGMDAKVRALLGAAIFVLLIGCANAATMVLAHMQGRRRELAIRRALGAGRGDLARPILVEATLLALVAAVAGLGLASWVAPPLSAMSPVDDLGPFFQSVGVTPRVALFSLLAALFVAVVFSIPAIFQSSGEGAGAILRSGRGNVGERRARRVLNGLVVAELAVAVVLLTGAGLMLKSVQSLRDRDLGIEAEGLLTFGIAPSAGGYEEVPDRLAFLEQVLERVQALPAVEGAAFTNFNPLRDQGWGAAVWPEERPPASETELITVNHRGVSPGFFQVSGIELRAGRGFTDDDGPGNLGVVVVSERLARRLWPGEDPLGRRLRTGLPSEEGPTLTVVGVAEDVADFGVLADTWYVPYAQDPSEFPTRVLEIFVRAGEETTAVVDGVRRAIGDLDPGLPVFNIQTAEEIVRFERRGEVFTTFLLSLFACIGLTLAAVGIYGVFSYTTSRKTREMGVRIALGAEGSEILGLVLRGALLIAGAGLALGLAAATVLTRFLESFLVEVGRLDPGVFCTMALGALVVAGLAALMPAWRATRVDPKVALQEGGEA